MAGRRLPGERPAAGPPPRLVAEPRRGGLSARTSAIDCRDYRAHQLEHRFVAGGWICPICAAEPASTKG